MFYRCVGQDVVVEDPAALDCALDAAANRRLGQFETVQQDPVGAHLSTRTTQYNLSGDAVVVVVREGIPSQEETYTVLARILESPEYFEACRTLPTDSATVNCLLEGFLMVPVGVCE